MPDTTVYGDDSRAVKSFFLGLEPGDGGLKSVPTARQLNGQVDQVLQG